MVTESIGDSTYTTLYNKTNLHPSTLFHHLRFSVFMSYLLLLFSFFSFPLLLLARHFFGNGKILHNGHDTRRLGALRSWINPVFGFLNPGFFFQGYFQNWQLFACLLFPTLCFLLFLNLSFHCPFSDIHPAFISRPLLSFLKHILVS
ncbi:hypothetical protein V8F06_006803 [Rhypophila decipiens]